MILFNNADRTVPLQNRKRLKKMLVEIISFNSLRLESLSFIFCSDEFLLSINQQFLQHDFYTDIITFDMSETKGLVNGEIYISIDRVNENAMEQKVSFKEELHRVIFHGALHLCGFKDKSKSDKQAMRNAENFWIDNYFSST